MYIKREDAINELVTITNESDMPEDWHKGMSVSISALYRVPSADVVEVVRCGVCKYCEEYETMEGVERTCGRVWCSPYDWTDKPCFYVSADDFCSYGERKERQ